jgi:hypothetical protein
VCAHLNAPAERGRPAKKTGRRLRGGRRGAGGQRCLRPALNRCSALTRAQCCRTELSCRAAQRPRPGTRVCTCARPHSGRTRTPAARPDTPARRPGTPVRTYADLASGRTPAPSLSCGIRDRALWRSTRAADRGCRSLALSPQPSALSPQPCAGTRRFTPVLTADRPRFRAADFSALCPWYCAAVQPQTHSVSGVCTGPVVPRRSETALRCPASRPAR